MKIRILEETDAEAWWRLRLEALETEPFAFGMSAEEHRAMPVEQVALRFRAASLENFTLGAFDKGRLAGTATFRRETGLKDLHKGRIFGVYVAAARRGEGLGRALIEFLIAEARKIAGVEQILLAVATCQDAAKGLYRGLGFETYGVEPNALKVGSRYIDEEHMILRL